MSLVYLDIETDNTNGSGLDVFNSKVVTLQILLPSGKTIILKDPKSLDNVKSVLENSLVIGHNLKFDSKFLKYHFGVTLYNVYDTYLAEIILSGGLYAGRQQASVLKLGDLVLKYCGQKLNKEEQQGFKYGVPLTKEQKHYAANDLKYLPEIYKQQQAKIKLAGLEDVINIEMKALPAIVWLELSGISIDQSKLSNFQILINNKRLAAKQTLYETLHTSKINLNSTQQLKKALNQFEIPVENTKSEELTKYSNEPVIKALIEYKEAEKLLNTFIVKLPTHINKKTGRVHADFFQIGAKSGRLSCTKPNLQQQPTRTLPEFRTIFQAAAGNKIITADYSQIELRILAQVSQDSEYIKAYNEGADLHSLTASKIFKKPLDAVEKKDRSIAKTVNFGIAYGMWTPGLQRKLQSAGIDITEKESEDIIQGFYNAYPGVAKYLRDISLQGLKKLELKNNAGRLIKFKAPNSDKERSGIKRESKNLPIQSLCADMVKIAMANIFLQLEPKGVKFINTVHDELVFECTEDQAEEVKKIVKTEMEKAGKLFLIDIPCIADVKINDAWEK